MATNSQRARVFAGPRLEAPHVNLPFYAKGGPLFGPNPGDQHVCVPW